MTEPRAPHPDNELPERDRPRPDNELPDAGRPRPTPFNRSLSRLSRLRPAQRRRTPT